MPHSILLQSPGGPDHFRWQEVPLPEPGPGQVRLKQEAVGVNFIDVYHRTGLYPLPAYPHGVGMEAAGVVEAVGEGARDFSKGDRVAYAMGGPGAYATHRVVDQSILVPLPASISAQAAAAIMVKGLTAHYLLTGTFKVRRNDAILVHAAAGGVGLMLCQWASHLGATVIGTVGSEEKASLAKANGCAHTILYAKEKVSQKVRELTQGKGVDVVYDSVGQATFMDSLDALKPLGMMVSFGQSSGKVPPFDISLLSQKGSLFLTRPTLNHYVADPARYRAMAKEVFDLAGKGVLKARIDRTLPLKDAAEAHRLLESRKTSGALVLLP